MCCMFFSVMYKVMYRSVQVQCGSSVTLSSHMRGKKHLKMELRLQAPGEGMQCALHWTLASFFLVMSTVHSLLMLVNTLPNLHGLWLHYQVLLFTLPTLQVLMFTLVSLHLIYVYCILPIFREWCLIFLIFRGWCAHYPASSSYGPHCPTSWCTHCPVGQYWGQCVQGPGTLCCLPSPPFSMPGPQLQPLPVPGP